MCADVVAGCCARGVTGAPSAPSQYPATSLAAWREDRDKEGCVWGGGTLAGEHCAALVGLLLGAALWVQCGRRPRRQPGSPVK